MKASVMLVGALLPLVTSFSTTPCCPSAIAPRTQLVHGTQQQSARVTNMGRLCAFPNTLNASLKLTCCSDHGQPVPTVDLFLLTAIIRKDDRNDVWQQGRERVANFLSVVRLQTASPIAQAQFVKKANDSHHLGPSDVEALRAYVMREKFEKCERIELADLGVSNVRCFGSKLAVRTSTGIESCEGETVRVFGKLIAAVIQDYRTMLGNMDAKGS